MHGFNSLVKLRSCSREHGRKEFRVRIFNQFQWQGGLLQGQHGKSLQTKPWRSRLCDGVRGEDRVELRFHLPGLT